MCGGSLERSLSLGEMGPTHSGIPAASPESRLEGGLMQKPIESETISIDSLAAPLTDNTSVGSKTDSGSEPVQIDLDRIDSQNP